jgi:hypothetical protein
MMVFSPEIGSAEGRNELLRGTKFVCSRTGQEEQFVRLSGGSCYSVVESGGNCLCLCGAESRENGLVLPKLSLH